MSEFTNEQQKEIEREMREFFSAMLKKHVLKPYMQRRSEDVLKNEQKVVVIPRRTGWPKR